MKKIKLDLEDDEHDVLEKITCGDKGDDGEIKGFPQLKESGGFEIMYCVSGCMKTWCLRSFISICLLQITHFSLTCDLFCGRMLTVHRLFYIGRKYSLDCDPTFALRSFVVQEQSKGFNSLQPETQYLISNPPQ